MPADVKTTKKRNSKPSSEGEPLPGALSLFNPSWEALKKNWPIVIFGALPIILVPLLAIAICQIIVHHVLASSTASFSHALTIVFNIISILIGIVAVVGALPLGSGLVYWAKIQSTKGVKVEYRQALKQGIHFYPRIIGLAICRGFVILIGLILLLVPGLFMWRRYLLAPYYLVDRDIGVFEAMRLSADSSKIYSGAIWGMLATYILIFLVSYIPIVGWAVGAVMGICYLCAAAVRYGQINKLGH